MINPEGLLIFERMNQVALVTGAASGLGYEFCRLLASDGYGLILIDRNEADLREASAKFRKDHGIFTEIYPVDLSVPGVVEQLWEKISEKRIDILINNAGFGLYGFFTGTDWKMEQDMLRLHVMTVTHLTKLVLGKMMEQGTGRILNVSSLAAFQPGPLMAIYYASKAYILSFSEALANELKGTGITVTVLAPGWFRTNFQKTTAENSHVEESRAKWHTATAAKVAQKGYRAMMRGRVYVIPGIPNKLMSMAPRVLPRRTMTAIIRRIQEQLR